MAESKIKLKQLSQDSAASGNVISWNGTNWVPSTVSSSGGSPSGSNYNIQFYSGGTFGANSNINVDPTNTRLIIGDTSGSATLHIKGNSNSTGANLKANNSDDISIMSILNNGYIKFGNGEIYPRLHQNRSANGSIDLEGTGLKIEGAFGDDATSILSVENSATNLSVGSYEVLSLSSQFSPTSGNADVSYLNIAPTLNQTGGANGILNGVNINPTLTAVVDFRAIHIQNNNSASWGIYQSGSSTKNYLNGNTGIGTNSPQQKLDVNGVLRIRTMAGVTPNAILGKDSNGDITTVSIGSGLSIGSGTLSATPYAPTNAQYVTLATNGTLSDERVLTAGTNIKIVDGGAGSTVTLSTATEDFKYTGIISPALITSDFGGYGPPSISTSTIVNLSGDSKINGIGGLPYGADGRIMYLSNVGDYPIRLMHQHSGTTSSDRFALYYPEVFIFPKQTLQVLYSSNLNRWLVLNSENIVQKYKNAYYYEAVAASTTLADHAYLNWSITNGTILNIGASTTAPAYSYLTTTASSSTIGFSFTKGVSQFGSFGVSHMAACATIRISSLSDNTNRFAAGLRLSSSPATYSENQNNSVGIRYSHNINGGSFQCFSRDNAGGESLVNTNISVGSSTIYTLFVCLNAAKTAAFFYIDNVFVGSITGNMPNSVAAGSTLYIAKTSGSGSKFLLMYKYSSYAIYP